MFNRKLIQAVPETRKIIATQVLFQCLGMLASVSSSLILCWLAAGLVQQSLQLPYAAVWSAAGIVFCSLLKTWSARRASACALRSGTLVKKTLRARLYEKLAQIGPGCTARWSTAELSQLMSEGIQQTETYFGQYIPQFFYALVAPVILFVITVFWNWKAALVLLVCVPLIPASIVAVQKFAKKLLARYWDQYTGLSDSFLENLQGLTTLKVYQADAARHKKMNEEAEQFRKMTMRVLIMQLNSISVMDAVAYGGSAAGMLLALAGYAGGQMSLFSMLGFILLSAEFFLPMRLLGSYFHISMNGSAAADKIFAVLKTPVQDGTLDLPTAARLRAEPVLFAADHLSYTYPAQDSRQATLALRDLQMAGLETRDIRRGSLLEAVTVSASDSMIFAGTVRDTLLAARPDATDEELQAVLEEVQLWKTLERKDGLDTVLEEKGQNFSGGQRQRLSLARALLKDSPVLLLDEATSSMDVLSENAVMEALRRRAENRLILVISHRLANLEHAEKILVLENGEQQGFAGHEDLLKDCAVYRRLWDAQQQLEAYAQKEEEEEA